MTTLQLLGAMLVGGMLFGWPLALLILRLAQNDARYPEPPVEPRALNAATCIHARGWLESAGVEPDDALRLCVRLRCRMCGDERLLPFQNAHNPPSNAADVIPFAGHGATMQPATARPHATRAV